MWILEVEQTWQLKSNAAHRSESLAFELPGFLGFSLPSLSGPGASDRPPSHCWATRPASPPLSVPSCPGRGQGGLTRSQISVLQEVQTPAGPPLGEVDHLLLDWPALGALTGLEVDKEAGQGEEKAFPVMNRTGLFIYLLTMDYVAAGSTAVRRGWGQQRAAGGLAQPVVQQVNNLCPHKHVRFGQAHSICFLVHFLCVVSHVRESEMSGQLCPRLPVWGPK